MNPNYIPVSEEAAQLVREEYPMTRKFDGQWYLIPLSCWKRGFLHGGKIHRYVLDGVAMCGVSTDEAPQYCAAEDITCPRCIAQMQEREDALQ